jgi:protein-disulfide isomerase
VADKKTPRRGGSSAKNPAKGPDLKLFYGLLVLVAVVGIAWIGYSVSNRGNDIVTAPVELTGSGDMQSLLRQAQGVTNGKDEAPVQVLVFSDFTCPACKIFATTVEPALRTEFIESGRVRFVYYDFPLGGDVQQHKWGFVAARAARCIGEQGKYWEFHDVLFNRQVEWSYQRDTPVKQFTEYAKFVGADPAPFEACLRSDKYAEIVTANRKLGSQLGVGSTPTVFVGSQQVAAWNDYTAVRAAVLHELGEDTAK